MMRSVVEMLFMFGAKRANTGRVRFIYSFQNNDAHAVISLFISTTTNSQQKLLFLSKFDAIDLIRYQSHCPHTEVKTQKSQHVTIIQMANGLPEPNQSDDNKPGLNGLRQLQQDTQADT